MWMAQLPLVVGKRQQAFHALSTELANHRRSSIMRADIVPGGIFPNYELPDHTGQMRKLSEL